MRPSDVPHLRLHHQRLSSPGFGRAAAVVKWLGAVQAQDFTAAKWALGLRMRNAVDEDIEKAFADGSILRTHVLRPTWHFVAPEDIRWMLELTAPRVNTAMGSYYRKSSLDAPIFKRSQKALAAALRGGRQLTRPMLQRAVERAGIATDRLTFVFILLRAELDGLICSGARIGAQFTYALLEDRVAKTQTMTRDEALATLARRYVASRGPATVQDFAWWSGLAMTDARAGIEMAARHLAREVINGRTYWLEASTSQAKRGEAEAYLLPAYDEYLIAYKDRSAALDPSHVAQGMNAILGGTIVLKGRIVGTWKRTSEKGALRLTLNAFGALRGSARRAVVDAASRYGRFLGAFPVISGM